MLTLQAYALCRWHQLSLDGGLIAELCIVNAG